MEWVYQIIMEYPNRPIDGLSVLHVTKNVEEALDFLKDVTQESENDLAEGLYKIYMTVYQD